MKRRTTLLLGAAGLALLACGAPAGADVFGPISLVSQGSLPGAPVSQQVNYAHDTAISGDRRYVAFDGSFAGRSGVWRRDLQTEEMQPVAVGAEIEGSESCVKEPSGAGAACDAELPSISAGGRYVSFTTTAPLAPNDDDNKGPDVYVRDMNVAISAQQSTACAEEELEATGPGGSCAFTLVSAVTGKTAGLTYEYAGTSGQQQFEEEHYGSLAGGRSALSADGREVAFVTTAPSDLLPAKPPALPATPTTPALQVAVRDLDTRDTQLVSVAYDPATRAPAVDPETGGPEPVSGVEGANTHGAVYIPGTTPPAFPYKSRAYRMTLPVGASLSADASTVAWLGQDVSAQAQTLPDETLPDSYTEPLWRRIAAGPKTVTRRITGGSDPANPACGASGERALPERPSPSDPCQGPFLTPHITNSGTWSGGTGDAVPQLSADGTTVAFLATAELLGRGGNFGVAPGEAPSDLYVVDMRDGLTRDQALRPLTEFAGGKPEDLAENAPIVDLGVSPDGTEVAFTTMRTAFPLGSPAYVSAPAAVPGMLELFDVDLANDTLTRVTQGYAGGPSEQPHPAVEPGRDPYSIEAGALTPSFADDGDALAFSSTASNLVYGDGNTPPNETSTTFDGSDTFVVSRTRFGATATPQEVSAAPGSSLTLVWGLGVTARSRPDGSVLLYVQVPGAGTLRAGARGAVPIRYTLPSRATRHTRGRSARHRRVISTKVATRVIATATKTTSASAGGLVTLTLKLAPAYSALASTRGGLSATVNLLFASPGRPALRQNNIEVTFLRKASTSRSKRRPPEAGKRSSKTGGRR
jgi:hypothetical protein